jgi:hypothetical protein
MHTEVERLCCPECGKEVDHTISHNGFQAGSTSIGPPLIKCPSCETLVYTGKREWDQQNVARKAWFVLSRGMWLVVGSIFVCGGAAGILQIVAVERDWIEDHQSTTFAITCYGVGTLFLSAVVIRNALDEIRTSLQRSQSDEARAMWTDANTLGDFAEVDSESEHEEVD